MSIRPIDQVAMVSRTQDLSKSRQESILKNQNFTHIYFAHLKKEVEKKSSKISDTEKTLGKNINNRKHKNSKNRYNEEEKRKNEKENDKLNSVNQGHIDIRI